MKNFLKNGGLVLVGSLAGISASNAAVPLPVSTALTDASADVTTIGGAVLAVIVVIAAFRYMRRTF